MPDLLLLALALFTTSVVGNASVADLLCSTATPLAWACCSWLWYQAIQDRIAVELRWKRVLRRHRDDPAWLSSANGRAAQRQYLRRRNSAREQVVAERSRWYIAFLFVLASYYAAFAAPQAVRPELRLNSLIGSLVILGGIAVVFHGALYSLFARLRSDRMIGESQGESRTLVLVERDSAEEMEAVKQRLRAAEVEIDSWVSHPQRQRESTNAP